MCTLLTLILHNTHSYEILLQDVQSEEEKDIVIELKLPAVEADEEEQLVLKTRLSYFDITSSKPENSINEELRVARRGKLS